MLQAPQSGLIPDAAPVLDATTDAASAGGGGGVAGGGGVFFLFCFPADTCVIVTAAAAAHRCVLFIMLRRLYTRDLCVRDAHSVTRCFSAL